MSFPNIPNITPLISVTVGQTIPLLLSSIALEELALAHIMNAEAEKLQFFLGTLDDTGVTLSPAEVSVEDLLDVNTSVRRTLRDVIKKEMLLEFKFENILDLITDTGVGGCVHTRGFFGNSPQGQALTAQLITDFGPIVLGIGNLGLSLTIDTVAKAQAVFNNNPPAPAPTAPPCLPAIVAQYHQLYAQLLAANLNVLNLQQQGFGVCPEATAVIQAANAFIAGSPPCGMVGAPAFSASLTSFNEGTLSPNCPPHCNN